MRENLLTLTLLIYLSSRHLSKDEISLLSKGLRFVPTPKHMNKAKIKEEIEVYGMKLRLMVTGSLMLISLRRNLNLILKGTLP